MPEPSEPLLFRRVAQPAVWGGRALVERLDVEAPDDGPIGETWELSDYPGKETAVRGGVCDGRTLQALLAEHREFLLGESRLDPHGRFPLLVKLIEARRDLSVQVHPPDGERSPTGVGKTEAWYVLPDSAPDAAVIAGLSPGVARAAFARDAASAAVLDHLRELPVRGGDCLLISAGTPHAIRSGTLLVEVQQTADLTYRMYDWGRVGLDGEPRETHVEQALEVIDFEAAPPPAARAEYPPVPAGVTPAAETAALVACPYFRLHEVRVHRAADHDPEGYARVLVVLSGTGTVRGPSGEARPLSFGDTVLLPAHLPVATFEPGADGLHLLEAVAL